MSGEVQTYVRECGCAVLSGSVPIAKALDLFRPGYDIEQRAIPLESQKTYTSRINITFRFYRPGKLLTPDRGSADRQTSIRLPDEVFEVHVKEHRIVNVVFQRKSTFRVANRAD